MCGGWWYHLPYHTIPARGSRILWVRYDFRLVSLWILLVPPHHTIPARGSRILWVRYDFRLVSLWILLVCGTTHPKHKISHRSVLVHGSGVHCAKPSYSKPIWATPLPAMLRSHRNADRNSALQRMTLPWCIEGRTVSRLGNTWSK